MLQDPHTEDAPTRVAIRIPAELAKQIRAIADRDANGISATARRLLAAALARETAALNE